jgi:cytochrome P450
VRLTDEALTIIGAGTVTTAHTLALTMFHILANASIRSKLQNELKEVHAEGDTITWNTLSHLPYLSATITEGLRLSFGVSHRLQRISPDTDLHYKQWTIAAGTPVSQTQMFVMTHPVLFPRPQAFVPERWMPDMLPEGFPHPHEAKKFFIPFSRGTRSCVGMNLAYAELFLTIGTLLKPNGGLEMELFETTQKDFEVEYDWFNPCPCLDSKGLQILIE